MTADPNQITIIIIIGIQFHRFIQIYCIEHWTVNPRSRRQSTEF